MNHLIKTIIITAGLSLTALFAGAGHSHGEHGHSHAKKEMSKSDIQINAKKYLSILVDKKRLIQVGQMLLWGAQKRNALVIIQSG